MAEGRRLTLRIAIMFAAVVVVFGGIAAVRRWRQETVPLGEPRLVKHIDSMSQSSMQQFLDGDFRIVKDMKALPEPVVMAFTEKGGSRLTIANPGERFEATDVIWDMSIPRSRLLFSGISRDKSLVLYERGGIGLVHILALFQLAAMQAQRQQCGEPFAFRRRVSRNCVLIFLKASVLTRHGE